MCEDCGEIMTTPMTKIALVQESFTDNPSMWVTSASDNTDMQNMVWFGSSINQRRNG